MGISRDTSAAVAAMSDVSNGGDSIKERIFGGEHVALTIFGMRDGPWVQVTNRNTALQRSGHGYLLLSLAAAEELLASLPLAIAKLQQK